MTTYALTGAAGKLGRPVRDGLLERADATHVLALAGDLGKLSGQPTTSIAQAVRDALG